MSPTGFGTAHPAARPPVWPPIAPDRSAEDMSGNVPPVPERLSASLDMTSDLPKVRTDEPSTEAGPGAKDEPAPPYRYADDLTMELPIFRELESAWFRAAGTAPHEERTAAPAAAGAPRAAEASDGAQDLAEDATTGAAMAGSDAASGGVSAPADEASWRSVADEGWLAAEAALTPQDGGITDTGLPRRVPMAQLVPGGVDPSSTGSDRRTPEAVRGLLSAYHRGVQRGRNAQGKAGEPTTTGSQTSGKEQEA
jgi:hypothetical protein